MYLVTHRLFAAVYQSYMHVYYKVMTWTLLMKYTSQFDIATCILLIVRIIPNFIYQYIVKDSED